MVLIQNTWHVGSWTLCMVEENLFFIQSFILNNCLTLVRVMVALETTPESLAARQEHTLIGMPVQDSFSVASQLPGVFWDVV